MGIFSLFGKSKQKASIDNSKTIATNISNIVVDFLNMQLSLHRDDNGNLPSKAQDNWSLGYVAGAADASLYTRNYEPSSDVARFTMIMVFVRIYGDSGYFDKVKDLQSSSDTELYSGMTAGGEIIDYLNASSFPSIPTKWSSHIQG
jgi:hypothetical protein